MKKLLWVGDACVSSGFARSTHGVLDTLRFVYDVSVLGMCYNGDPHDHPYRVYPAFAGGDSFGVGRIRGLVESLKPDVIVVQQDPWNFPAYLTQLTGIDVPVVGVVAVDGKNCAGENLNPLALSIFWTQFGEQEARVGGYTGPSAVIPLGVDLDVYKPLDRADSKEKILGKVLSDHHLSADSFVVGVVGRNQERKRLDLTLRYFANWAREFQVEDACLWCHVAPTGEAAYDLRSLAKYYGILGRVFVPAISPIYGLPEEALARIYNLFDVLLSTTQGEGMWLPGLEAAACGVPIIAPDWSAVGELFSKAAALVSCTSMAVTPHIGGAVLGGIADETECIAQLNALYRNKALRTKYANASLALASEDRFRWPNIGDAFSKALDGVFARQHDVAWQDLGRPEEVTS